MSRVLAPSADAAVLPDEPRRVSVRAAVVVGLAAGVVSFAAYDALPAPWDRLGDSAALWGLLTWWAGQRVRPVSLRWSALVGLLTQLCLLAGFYGALVVLAGRSDDPVRVAAWTLLALVAGPVLGVLGGLRWARERLPVVAAALVGALVVLEPLVGVLPLLVGELRTPPPGVENIGPAPEDLVWCAVALVAGLAVAAAAGPRGRRLAPVVLAVVVVAGCAAVVAARAAWYLLLW